MDGILYELNLIRLTLQVLALQGGLIMAMLVVAVTVAMRRD